MADTLDTADKIISITVGLLTLLGMAIAAWLFFTRNPDNRSGLTEVLLRAGKVRHRYRRTLLRLLRWAKRGYGAHPLGWEGLARSIQVALVYPIICLTLAYVAGAPVDIGGMTLLPVENAAGQPYGFIILIGWALGFLGVVSFITIVFTNRDEIDGTIARLAQEQLPSVPPIIVRAGMGFVLGVSVYAVEQNIVTAGYLLICATFFSVAIAIAIAIAIAGVAVGAAAGAGAAAGVATMGVVIAVTQVEARALVLTAAAAVAVAVALALSFIAPLIGIHTNASILTIMLALFFLLPLVNAMMDHLSVAASRWLLGMAARETPLGRGRRRLPLWLSTAMEIAADILFALACLIALAFFLPLASQAMNGWFGLGDARLDWRAYVEATRTDPLGAGLAGTLMLASTLVPTLIHTVLGLACIIARPFARLSRAGRALDGPQQGDRTALGALTCTALAFLPPLILTVVFVMAGGRILDTIARWLGEDGFGGLLYDAALYGGAQGTTPAAALWLATLVFVVGGLTVFMPRAFPVRPAR